MALAAIDDRCLGSKARRSTCPCSWAY